MDIFDEEIIHFWRALQKNGVRYIMVGGYATNLHGYQRYTGDMDIWIEDTSENRKRLRDAFAEYGFRDLESLETIQFIPGWTDFYLKNGMKLDLMTSMKGLEIFDFSDSHQMAAIADIEDVQVPFLHLNQLLANKKAVNRPKDQVDVIYLEKIQKLKEEGQ